MVYASTSGRMAEIQNGDTPKCWQGAGEPDHPPTAAGADSLQNSWQFLQKLHKHLAHGPVPIVPGMCFTAMKSRVRTKHLRTGVWRGLAARAPPWTRPRQMPHHRWIKQTVAHPYRGYCSATERDEGSIHGGGAAGWSSREFCCADKSRSPRSRSLSPRYSYNDALQTAKLYNRVADEGCRGERLGVAPKGQHPAPRGNADAVHPDTRSVSLWLWSVPCWVTCYRLGKLGKGGRASRYYVFTTARDSTTVSK